MGNESAARSRLMQARIAVEQGRWDWIDGYLAAGASFLDGPTEDEAVPMRAEIEAMRAQTGEGPAGQGERTPR